MSCARPIRSIALLLAAAASARADIIDRIAVSVGAQVITTSDIDREIRVLAFLQGSKPDFSAANRHSTADRMVEQKLIRHEMESSRYPLPKPSQVDGVVAQLRKKYLDGAAYEDALRAYQISDTGVREVLLWQRTLLLFVDDRFRPAVQVTEQDVKTYFEQVVAPAAGTAHPGRAVTLDEYRDQIERTLTGQRTDEEMDRWLKEARGRTAVIYHEEALQ